MPCRTAREGCEMTFHQGLIRVTTLAIVTIVAPAAMLAQLPQPPRERPIDAAQVLAAIDHGVAFLKREQQPRGNWAEFPGYEGGVTALCTLALLNSGVPADDPNVKQALSYLRE